MFKDVTGINFDLIADDNISMIENWNVSNVTDMSYMFDGYIV